MRYIFSIFICVSFLAIKGFSQNSNGKLDLAEEYAEKYTVPFTMPDGTQLMTDVYLPITQDSLSISFSILGESISIEVIPKGMQYIIFDSLDGKINDRPYEMPVIFIRTPYNKNTEALGYFLAFLGYAAVIQDNRGCYSSEGVYLPMYSDSWLKEPYHKDINHLLDITSRGDRANANLHEDGYQSLRFILDSLKREYRGETIDVCNGLIGMLGASALGNVQYQLASAHKIDPSGPGLKCLFPVVATNEHYRFTAFQNGVFREQLVSGWITGQFKDLVNDELSVQDSSIFNSIHSPADYQLGSKYDAAEKAIDYWVSFQPDNGPAGHYPNSVLRPDMDASFAHVDTDGEGDPEGSFSRYGNLEVPIYHLTGWWDIFIGGQIETYNQLMQNLSDEYGHKSLQKLVIGPWAHQTVTMKSTGDMDYPDNVQDFLFNLLDVELNLEKLPVEKLYDSEPMQWFRTQLNHNRWKNIGDPKIIIPESETWQSITSDIKIRIPDRDIILPYTKFLNFLSGNTDLDSVSFAVSTNSLVTSSRINIPGLDPPLISMEKLESEPLTDFSQIPNVRLYVTGPRSDGNSMEQPAGNYWFKSDSFPFAKDIIWQKIYLHENQELHKQLPGAVSGSSNYVHDPKNPVWTVGGANMITRTPSGDRRSQGQMNLADPLLAPYTMTREDVLSFESNVMTDTFSIIGFPVANIFASSSPLENQTDSTSTDFFVRILDVYPDGGEYFVVEGAINARAREYAKQLITGEEDPNIPFTNISSGRVYEYNFKMMPIAYTFGKGHKIKLLISSSNHPRYQSNPNLPVETNAFFRWKPGDELRPRKALQSIYFSNEYPSNIDLPVYKGQIIPSVSVEKNITKEIPDIRIFPNPASEFLFIEAGVNGNTLEIYTLTGKKMLAEIIDASYSINVESWDSGIYILHLTNVKSNIFHSQKIIVNKH
jgi:predicted acyl esterase